MTATLAHEIRNPIAAMRLKAENALAQTPDKQQQALTAVLQQVHRLNSLLQRLMAIIRPVSLEPEPVAVRTWMQERITHHQDHADRSGVTLHADAPEATAIFDGNSMARALDNLLLNALQHTPAGGTIDVTVHLDENRNRTIFCVEDSGPGVPDSEQEHIFEPFMTTRADGSGLGLAIVREIAEAQQGTVRYERGRRGARFIVELPWRPS
jgi:signal transduction histidine kinase